MLVPIQNIFIVCSSDILAEFPEKQQIKKAWQFPKGTFSDKDIMFQNNVLKVKIHREEKCKILSEVIVIVVRYQIKCIMYNAARRYDIFQIKPINLNCLRLLIQASVSYLRIVELDDYFIHLYFSDFYLHQRIPIVLDLRAHNLIGNFGYKMNIWTIRKFKFP